MESIGSAALLSWTLDWRVIALLALTALIYVRGWLRGRKLLRDERDRPRLAAFLSGLTVVFLAVGSPLDAFDGLFLSAHMAQHLLLLMFAPPLLLLSHPTLPLLRGLPRQFVREGLGPFLAWPVLKSAAAWLTSPLAAWAIFAFSTIFWHVPVFYELALSSPVWHAVQHASFFWSGIIFWWPIIQPGPKKARWPRWVGIPYLLFADILNTALSALFVFSGRLLYPSYEVVSASGVRAQEDQTLAGLIMWVPGSIVYLLPAFALVMQVLSGRHERQATLVARVKQPAKKRRPNSIKMATGWRRGAQWVMLALAIAVMADGFFGQQVAPLNLAGALPWIYWRAAAVFALLAVGNMFCMVCPFTLVRDLARKVLPANLRWPRALRSKWLPAVLFVIYLWAYEAFSIWESPWLTAWIITGYFVAALLVDGLFRGASFCKYVCPIGQFHFVTSLVSPREVKVRSGEVCRSCKTYDCIRGNNKTRGCELDLFQPRKASNLDCTFCLDCVKACPHDNVAVLAVLPGRTLLTDQYRSSLGRLSKRTDLAALALMIVFGAFVNAAGMVSPVMAWQHRWHARLGAYSMPFIVAAFVALGVLVAPAAVAGVCKSANGLVQYKGNLADIARRFAFVLVPVGVAMWAAHLSFHVMGSVPPVQILLLDSGLLLTIYLGWGLARQCAENRRSAFGLLAPWALTACGLYAAGLWILFQPMQMRGMMH